MACCRVTLIIVSVNKVVKKLAKGVKGYLRLRSSIQLKHVRCRFLLLGLPGRSLGGYGSGSSLLGSFMIILSLPKVRFGL